MKYSPPRFEDLDGYYQSYWKYLKEDDLFAAMAAQQKSMVEWLNSLPPGVEDYAYGEGKWRLKEVVGHLCDTERILTYRALTFARNDQTELPGFEENDYMIESNFKNRSLKDICEEWNSVRAATLSLFLSMTDEFLDRKGTANNSSVTPRIIFYFVLVHARHHSLVIKERYLSKSFSA